jgi:hypothetical protein
VLQFKEHGVEAIEVQDNGRGIGQSDWAGIGASRGERCTESRDQLTEDFLLLQH